MSESKAPRRTSRFRTDVLVMYGGKLGIGLLMLFISVVLARELGPTGRGAFAVAYSATQIFVQLGALGFVTANPYFAASGRAQIHQLMTAALWAALGLGIALVGLGLTLRALAPQALAGLDWPSTIVALSMIPAMLTTLFLQGLLLGEQRAVAYAGVELTQATLTFVGLVVAFFVLNVTATGALAVVGASWYVTACLLFWLLREHTPRLSGPDVPLLRAMLRYGLRIYLSTVLSFLVIRLDILLVNRFLGQSDAGIYSVVGYIVEGLCLLPGVIALNLFTRVAAGASGQMSAQLFRSVALLWGSICLLSVPFAGPVIRALYGEQFAEAVSLFYWIVPGMFSLGLVIILSHDLAGREFPRAANWAWSIGLALNVAINVALLKSAGIFIASLSSSIAYTLVLALLLRLYVRGVGGWGAVRPDVRETVRFVRVALSRDVPA